MSEPTSTPLVDVLTDMTEASIERNTLDPQTFLLVRFAALVAMDAPPASYMFHLGAGAELGLTLEDARQVLVALAPLVGTARTVAATGQIARGLGLALSIADIEDDV
jgi:alkylhydroperoxidase/carboxymuconolactone decarboxylase family protein YurZ